MKTTSFYYCIFVLAASLMTGGSGWAQPVWEDISPLPGHRTISVSRDTNDNGGLWASVYEYEGVGPAIYYRPWHSCDGGDTWELRDGGMPEGLGVFAIVVNPHNSQRLLASAIGDSGVNMGPWLSTDQGRSWIPTRSCHIGRPGMLDIFIKCGWFGDGTHAWYADYMGESGAIMHLSADSGVTWSDSSLAVHNPDQFISNSLIPTLALCPDEPYLYRTFDFGYTWARIRQPNQYYGFNLTGTGWRAEDLYGTTLYYVRGVEHPYWLDVSIVSTDTGATWAFINPNDTLTWAGPRVAIGQFILDPRRNGHMLGITLDSLFESTDGGINWTGLCGDTAYFQEYSGLACDPTRDWIFQARSIRLHNDVWQHGLWRWRRGMNINSNQRSQPLQQIIQVYPNPAAGNYLQLVLPAQAGGILRLYDLLGRQITMMPIKRESAAHGLNLPLPYTLPSGTYFITLQSGQQNIGQKIIIQR